MDKVVDLDILRPEKRMIKLNGKTIDVSFIPLAISFEVDELLNKLSQLKADEKGEMDKPTMKEAFDLTIELCAFFACVKDPDMNAEWFKKNVSAEQINSFANEIKEALNRSYKGLEEYGKN